MTETRREGRFRPGPGATLATLAGLVLLLGLGTWQLQRLAWKEALLADIAERTTAEPVPLPTLLERPVDWRYRRVLLEGVLDHSREMRVASGRGFEIVTPLLRDGAPAVLLVRGRYENIDSIPRPAGPQSVRGIVRLSPKQGLFKPENDPTAGLWYWRDLKTMAAAAGLDDVAPVFVEAEGHVLTRLDIPNNHLAYAATWYGLAAVLLAVYIAYGRQRGA